MTNLRPKDYESRNLPCKSTDFSLLKPISRNKGAIREKRHIPDNSVKKLLSMHCTLYAGCTMHYKHLLTPKIGSNFITF